jgi:hypothetical protein
MNVHIDISHQFLSIQSVLQMICAIIKFIFIISED